MAKSYPVRPTAAADLRRMLNGYLDGQLTIEDFLAWEAELSLDAEAVGALRPLLDRLSIVAAEVCDGLREEGEFRALAREAFTAALAGERAAVAEAPGSYRVADHRDQQALTRDSRC